MYSEVIGGLSKFAIHTKRRFIDVRLCVHQRVCVRRALNCREVEEEWRFTTLRQSGIAGRVRLVKAEKPSTRTSSNRNPKLAARVERALLRAGETARRTARMHGTPFYFWENGKVVVKRP